MKALLLLALLLAFSARAEDARVTALVTQGDAEDRQCRARDALSSFEKAEQIEPQNVGVLLRISRELSELVDTASPRPVAEQLANRSLEYAKRALALDGNNAKTHLSVAVGYAKMVDYVSSKVQVEYSRVIRDEAQKAIEMDPNDDYAWHVLGRWNFAVAHVSAVVKAIAKLAYGGLPAASDEEAIRCFRKAEELAPQRVRHHAALAHVYKAMGKADLARKEWETMLSLQAADAGEERDRKEARENLASR